MGPGVLAGHAIKDDHRAAYISRKTAEAEEVAALQSRYMYIHLYHTSSNTMLLGHTIVIYTYSVFALRTNSTRSAAAMQAAFRQWTIDEVRSTFDRAFELINRLPGNDGNYIVLLCCRC